MTSGTTDNAPPLGPGALITAFPLCAEMGMEFVSADETHALLRLPYSDDLIGEPSTGVISGGAVTALLDTCCASAVIAKAKRSPVATLDLRIDYMRPATPHQALFAEADCYRVTRTIGFVRAIAFHSDRAKPIASAAATIIFNDGAL